MIKAKVSRHPGLSADKEYFQTEKIRFSQIIIQIK